MKKMLVASVVAVALVATVEQQASAWTKFSFGVGLNASYEGGGNSLLWGLIKGAPSPNQMVVDPTLQPPINGYHGGAVDGAFGAPAPSDFGKPLPKDPEKVGPPMPVKPAAFYEYKPQIPAQQNQGNTEEEPEYYYPSYYYGR